jgi:hypothetical protein
MSSGRALKPGASVNLRLNTAGNVSESFINFLSADFQYFGHKLPLRSHARQDALITETSEHFEGEAVRSGAHWRKPRPWYSQRLLLQDELCALTPATLVLRNHA